MQLDGLASVRRSNQSLRILLESIVAAGIDHEAILTSSGIDPKLAADPLGEITGLQELRFRKAFVEATRGVPGLWVLAGLRYGVMCYGSMGIAAMASATLGDALKVMTQYQTLNYSFNSFHLAQVENEGTALVAQNFDIPLGLQQFEIERALGAVYRFLSDITRGALKLEGIECFLKRPSGWLHSDELFNTPVSFGCHQTRWIFSADVLANPLPMANQWVAHTHELICARTVASLCRRNDLVGRLYMLLEGVQGGFLSASEAARRLATSERTLHRRLMEQGLTFSRIVESVREQRARRLLAKRDCSITQVADLLGYAEAASFSRAFKRWTGMPPSRYQCALSDCTGSVAPFAPATGHDIFMEKSVSRQMGSG